tara:strand:+ start:1078 stop:2481 length:1404 start_codon:yes stop_codon:yes gene_type:complete
MAVIDPIDPFASGVDVSSTNDQSSELSSLMMDRFKPDYDKNFAKYQERLAPYTYQAPSMSIYDLASELGAGLLATPNTGGASAFTGLGVGFTRVSDKLKKDQEANAKANQQIALQAASMAMQDEQKATEFLNSYDLKRIDAANKKVDYITFEFDAENEDGSVSKVTQTFPNIASSREEINDIINNKNGIEVKTSDTTFNMPDPNAFYAERKAIDAINASGTSYREKADASRATRTQVNQAYLLAIEAVTAGKDAGMTEDEVFGPFSSATLKARELVINLGFGGLLEAEGTVAPLKALNQLSMNFVMGIVSQTKGAISEREMDLFINASPTIGSTYDGFLMQLQMLEKLASRDEDFYRDYLTEMVKLEDEEIYGKKQKIRLEQFTLDWSENNPLLTPKEEKLLQNAVDNPNIDETFVPSDYRKLIEDTKKEQARKKALLPTVTTKAAFDALESGDRYIGSDDEIYEKP